ncbi:MAG: hypothetical protein H9Q65_05140 [Spiroplasma ixodetis]|nr:hypothetical protein [Spiroplasma ixodetis]MBP1527369.1 hypothetical protein [Spiroplasma ixodetis]MBP1528609.1 hypothetical protein [Spiroplasma ixodetis]
MKKLLITLSTLIVATTAGNFVLNTQIKTTNILNNEPIKYDGEDKIIDDWDFTLELVISSVYIKSSTLDNWNRIFSLHDNEKLKNKIYEDISTFPYKIISFFDKTDLNVLSKTLTDNFSSLISVPGHSTFGVIVTYHAAPKRVFYKFSKFTSWFWYSRKIL